MTDATIPLPVKASLTRGTDGPVAGAERTPVTPMRFFDGPNGVRDESLEGAAGGVPFAQAFLPATCFPAAVAMASAWDPTLLERVGAALAAECTAKGVDVLLAPGMNIKRSPLCGRNFEYFSEDPLIAAACGAAIVRGLQDAGVGASMKHFAANNQETARFRVSADIDERPLREIYLRAFGQVVREARPWTVMAAYNSINGVPATENHWLLTKVLREEWGYDGLVISDWDAVRDRVAALRAGLDLQMPEPIDAEVADAAVVAAVQAGELDGARLDEAVRRLTELSRRVGGNARPTDARPPYDTHHELAREVAARSIVLLKNEPVAGTPVLPLDPTAGRIAIIGELARNPRYQGNGSSEVNPTHVDTPLECIKTVAPEITFESGYQLTGEPNATHEDALRAAREADTTLLFLGLIHEDESEGFDRDHIDLPAEQISLVTELAAVTDRLVVVHANGGVVRVTPWQDGVPAVVETWLAGQAGGAAIADVLFGAVNPSGKTTETIPLRLADAPSYLNFPGEHGHVRYGEGVFVGYRGYDAAEVPVAYPFGHGLSYTDFAYTDLTITEVDGEIRAHLTVTNTGTRSGREVVQLYAAPPADSIVARAPRELRAFASATLEPGQSAPVELQVPIRELAYYSCPEAGWRVESGTYRFELGASSRDIRLVAEYQVVGDDKPALTAYSTLRDWVNDPVGGQLIGELLTEMTTAGGAELTLNPMLLRAGLEMTLADIGRMSDIPIMPTHVDALLARYHG